MSEFWTKVREFAGPGIAIIIGVAFASTIFVSTATIRHAIEKDAIGDVDRYDLIVSESPTYFRDGASDEQMTKDLEQANAVLSAQPEVEESWFGWSQSLALKETVQGAGNDDMSNYASLSRFPGSRTEVTMIEGRKPTAPNEIVLGQADADAMKKKIGDVIEVTAQNRVDSKGEKPTQTPAKLTVVGIHDRFYGGPMPGTQTFLAAQPIGGPQPPSFPFKVSLKDTGKTSEVAASLQAKLPKKILAEPASVFTSRAIARSDAKTAQQVMFATFGGFAVISLIVMAMVVANSFGIVLSRRSRQAALRRCVGATQGQLVRTTVGEAFFVAAVFGIAGAVVGISLCSLAIDQAAKRIPELPKLEVNFGVIDVATPVIIGIVVTALAVWLPALKAARISPLAALHPSDPVTATRKGRTALTTIGLVMVAIGAVLLVLAPTAKTPEPLLNLAMGLLGGLTVFIGYALANTVIVPFVLRLLGKAPSKVAGVPGELAVENSVRHPARTSILTSALMVGITLIVTTAVGAASLTETMKHELMGSSPYDASIYSNSRSSDETVKKALTTPGVEKVAGHKTITVNSPTVPTWIEEMRRDGHDPVSDRDMTGRPGVAKAIDGQYLASIKVFNPEVAKLARGRVPTPVTPEPGTVLVNEGAAEGWRVKAGDLMTFTGDNGTQKLKVVLSKDINAEFVVDEATASKMQQPAFSQDFVVRFNDEADLETTTKALQKNLAGLDGAWVDSPVAERLEMEKVTKTAVLVITALLGLSALIALVGVANTIALSVVERRKESSLVRALGVTKNQLRGTFLIETVLFAVVAIVMGSALGIWFGLAGAETIAKVGTDTAGRSVNAFRVIPWGFIGTLGGIGFALALLLTAVPSWQSARVAPAAGLSRD